MFERIITLFLLLILVGCAEGNSIYHNRPLAPLGDRVITLDAKQRNLLVTKDQDGQWRICAEAAPDVFSALSASASLSADVTTKSGRAAAAIAESAGTIERTQTINLLRESLYHTCLRYLNGSIGRGQLVVQAARDQRAMVKVLAIEQLTRTVRAPSTILSAPATSSSTVDGDAVAGLIKDLAKERATAKTALDGAKAAQATALAAGKCDTVTAAPSDDSGDPKLTDWTKCNAAAATLSARQKDFDDASGRFDKALAALPQLGSQSASSTSAGSVNPGGGGAAISDTALASVASAVAMIIEAPDIDEPLMFCIAYLDGDSIKNMGQPIVPKDSQTMDSCREILARRAAQDVKVRQDLFDLAGNKIDLLDARQRQNNQVVALLFKYVTTPAGKEAAATAERKRRIALVQSAGAMLGVPIAPADVLGLATTGNPQVVRRIVETLRQIETVDAGKAALQ